MGIYENPLGLTVLDYIRENEDRPMRFNDEARTVQRNALANELALRIEPIVGECTGFTVTIYSTAGVFSLMHTPTGIRKS